MDVVEVLGRMGGVARSTDLETAATRKRVRRAIDGGGIVRLSRGRLALPGADTAVARAHELSGVVSDLSAAAWWGWATKQQPTVPQVTVPKDRRVTGSREGIHFVDLVPGDLQDGIVTSRSRTLLDCLRREPFDAALAVADSALRCGVRGEVLDTLAAQARGPGAPSIRRVAALADGRAANPFESVLRALALEAGLDVEPQRRVSHGREWIVPDLVDVGRGVVLEADSFTWHSDRAAMRRDCQRYNWLVRHGWRVFRLTWEDVMLDQGYADDLLRALVGPVRRAKV